MELRITENRIRDSHVPSTESFKYSNYYCNLIFIYFSTFCSIGWTIIHMIVGGDCRALVYTHLTTSLVMNIYLMWWNVCRSEELEFYGILIPFYNVPTHSVLLRTWKQLAQNTFTLLDAWCLQSILSQLVISCSNAPPTSSRLIQFFLKIYFYLLKINQAQTVKLFPSVSESHIFYPLLQNDVISSFKFHSRISLHQVSLQLNTMISKER